MNKEFFRALQAAEMVQDLEAEMMWENLDIELSSEEREEVEF